MKTVSVREMKANWAEIERQIAAGETFMVLNRGKPSVKLVPARRGRVLKWKSHLDMAIETEGKSGTETILEEREAGN